MDGNSQTLCACANAQSVTKEINELDAEWQRKSVDTSATTEIWLKDDIHSICQANLMLSHQCSTP